MFAEYTSFLLAQYLLLLYFMCWPREMKKLSIIKTKLSFTNFLIYSQIYHHFKEKITF